MNDQTDTKLARIEDKIDRPVAGAIAVRRGSGMVPHSMAECMEAAKMMAIAQQAVPKHLRGEPGLCLGVVMQAVAWEMDVFAVARNSFVVSDQLSYMSQLLHAVIEQRAPLKGRLRCTYDGEGPDRTCTVSGTFEGEVEPHTYTTPKFKDIPVKNSPLWKWDIDQQMFYFASRAWSRKWCPDVLLGVYSPDEAQYAGATSREVTDVVVNPLGGDDEPMVNIKVADPDGNPIEEEGYEHPEPHDAEAPTEAVRAPEAEKLPKQRAAKKNAPAGPAGAGQAIHPDTIKDPPATAAARWGFEQYKFHVTQWVDLAVEAAGNIDGFLAETYIKNRYEKERTLRNRLGGGLTAEQKAEILEFCREAVNIIKARGEAHEAP